MYTTILIHNKVSTEGHYYTKGVYTVPKDSSFEAIKKAIWKKDARGAHSVSFDVWCKTNFLHIHQATALEIPVKTRQHA